MTPFALTRLALDDLRSIARFTETNWGKPCDEIRPGYRKFPQGSHLIFYRNGSDGVIEIIRILHGSMDHETAFPER